MENRRVFIEKEEMELDIKSITRNIRMFHPHPVPGQYFN
jgi:hypothetical protein